MTLFDLYFHQALAGVLKIDNTMRMQFEYDEAYLRDGGKAISLTMPITQSHYEDAVVFPFIENLLPEGEVRSLIQQQNKIEDGNYSRFIELLGGDVAGAISIQLQGEIPKFEKVALKNGLGIDALSQLLLEIQDKPFNVHPENKVVGNRLSLAGAQNKLPVICQDRKIYEAINAPSTHIIKPARKDNRFKSLVYNEFICMKAAALAGINVAEVRLLSVNDERGNESDALLITRYDREFEESESSMNTKRLQQEDLCQLCSVASSMKYEVSGGPGFEALFAKIKAFSFVPVKDDLEVFRRMIFNLVIGNYDAHAKNFSFLIRDKDRAILSPAYDLVCTALYSDLDTTFAMHVGSANTLEALSGEAFQQLFEAIDKKYSTMRKQLLKFADVSLNALTKQVANFIEGDFYQDDIKAAERLLRIARKNHQVVIEALSK